MKMEQKVGCGRVLEKSGGLNQRESFNRLCPAALHYYSGCNIFCFCFRKKKQKEIRELKKRGGGRKEAKGEQKQFVFRLRRREKYAIHKL